MATAGFKFSLTLAGVETSYQNIEFGHSNPGIPASSRLLRDGTVNPGVVSREPDLREGVIRVNSLVGPPGFPPNITVGANVVAWVVKYDGVTLASGARLYVETHHFSGSIPGAAIHNLLAYTDESFTSTY